MKQSEPVSEMKLRECPFCGSKPLMEVLGGKGSTHRTINCTKCKCDLHWQPTEEGAIAAWNHRPTEDALIEALRLAHKVMVSMRRTLLEDGGGEMPTLNAAITQVDAALAKAGGQ